MPSIQNRQPPRASTRAEKSTPEKRVSFASAQVLPGITVTKAPVKKEPVIDKKMVPQKSQVAVRPAGAAPKTAVGKSAKALAKIPAKSIPKTAQKTAAREVSANSSVAAKGAKTALPLKAGEKPSSSRKASPGKEPLGALQKALSQKARTSKTPVIKARSSQASPVLKAQLSFAMPQTKPESKNESKSRRARVPANLAAQYGERGKTREALPAVGRKARRDARAREERARVMMPSDELMQRLARAGAIAANGIDVAPRRAKPLTKRRSRKWESRCGKCAIVTTFSVSAGLCARCGAIAIREM